MKEQYLGDVKDYGKFRLLKLLCETTGLRLGVNWYLTVNDSSKQGNHGTIQNCKDSLYSTVAGLKKPNATAADVMYSNILPENTVYYNSLLEYSTQPVNKTRRYNWHQAALKVLDNCNIIFLDPDTGIIANEYHDERGVAKDNFFRPNEQRDGTRYVSITEIKNYLANGKSLVLFQYGIRVGGIDAQLHTVNQKLTQFIGRPTNSYIFRYSQSVNDEIAFIFYVQPAHKQRMERFERALLDSSAPWSIYFAKWDGPTQSSASVKAKQTTQKSEAEPVLLVDNSIPKLRENASSHERLRVLLMLIPAGKVTTYGWLATQIYGSPGKAQGILSMLKGMTNTVPSCHRVVSNDGQPKAINANYGNTGKTHKQLLQSEGVLFSGSSTIDMSRCMCKPRLPKSSI